MPRQTDWQVKTNSRLSQFCRVPETVKVPLHTPRCLAAIILNFGTWWKWVVNFMMRPPYRWGKDPTYQLEVGWAPESVWMFRRRVKSLASIMYYVKLGLSSTLSSHYTDDAIWSPVINTRKKWTVWKHVSTTMLIVYLYLFYLSFIISMYSSLRPEQLSRYSNSLQVGWFGVWNMVGLKLCAPVQTCPGAHPASYTMGKVARTWH